MNPNLVFDAGVLLGSSYSKEKALGSLVVSIVEVTRARDGRGTGRESSITLAILSL